MSHTTPRAPRSGRTILLPGAHRPPTAPTVREHARLFVLATALVTAAGSLLLALPWTTERGEATAPVDALFTAVSAIATTGLVTVDTASHWNGFGEAVILILMQVGGLGYMVGAGIALQMLRHGAASYGPRDALLLYDGAPTVSLRQAVDLSRRILRFTLAVEAVGILLLALRFWRDMPFPRALWHGLFYAVSAFSNASFDLGGGFSSLSAYRTSVWVGVVVMLLIQAGALSYVALADAATKRRWRPLALDTKLVLLVHALLVVAGAAVFLAAEWRGAMTDVPVWARPMVATFESVATRTAGFSLVDFAALSNVTLFVWIGLMFVGGAPGSTAGGIKLTTLGIVIAAVLSTLRGEAEPQLFGRRIPTPLVFRALTVISLMAGALFLTTLALSLTEGGDAPSFLALFFEAASALATAGFSTGITPSLSTAGKLVLIAAMLFGRLGPLTAAYALQRRRRPPRYRYPEAPVRIG